MAILYGQLQMEESRMFQNPNTRHKGASARAGYMYCIICYCGSSWCSCSIARISGSWNDLLNISLF